MKEIQLTREGRAQVPRLKAGVQDDFEGGALAHGLAESAVFTTTRCALPHQSAARTIHQEAALFGGSSEPSPAGSRSGRWPPRRRRTLLSFLLGKLALIGLAREFVEPRLQRGRSSQRSDLTSDVGREAASQGL